jgi:hypothetical protein
MNKNKIKQLVINAKVNEVMSRLMKQIAEIEIMGIDKIEKIAETMKTGAYVEYSWDNNNNETVKKISNESTYNRVVNKLDKSKYSKLTLAYLYNTVYLLKYNRHMLTFRQEIYENWEEYLSEIKIYALKEIRKFLLLLATTGIEVKRFREIERKKGDIKKEIIAEKITLYSYKDCTINDISHFVENRVQKKMSRYIMKCIETGNNTLSDYQTKFYDFDENITNVFDYIEDFSSKIGFDVVERKTDSNKYLENLNKLIEGNFTEVQKKIIEYAITGNTKLKKRFSGQQIEQLKNKMYKLGINAKVQNSIDNDSTYCNGDVNKHYTSNTIKIDYTDAISIISKTNTIKKVTRDEMFKTNRNYLIGMGNTLEIKKTLNHSKEEQMDIKNLKEKLEIQSHRISNINDLKVEIENCKNPEELKIKQLQLCIMIDGLKTKAEIKEIKDKLESYNLSENTLYSYSSNVNYIGKIVYRFNKIVYDAPVEQIGKIKKLNAEILYVSDIKNVI